MASFLVWIFLCRYILYKSHQVVIQYPFSKLCFNPLLEMSCFPQIVKGLQRMSAPADV
jgi:hypothetical protein